MVTLLMFSLVFLRSWPPRWRDSAAQSKPPPRSSPGHVHESFRGVQAVTNQGFI